jgi:hypothetical protein
MALTAADFRQALAGLPDDAPVELRVSDDDTTEFTLDGVKSDGVSLVIRISPDTESDDEGYVYRYLDIAGRPLERCPECGGSFTEPGGITVEFTDGTNEWSRKSRLGEDGRLDDPARDVLYGFHSATRCGHCQRMLLDMDGVEEVEEGYEDDTD